MKQCLITGGGSKFGAKLTELLIQYGYHVHLITSNPGPWQDRPGVAVIPVDWKLLTAKNIRDCVPAVPYLDLVFFNHNASALSQNKFQPATLQNLQHWQHSYFVACQFPFYLIHALGHRITPETKIGWMLSELITKPVDSEIGYADYIGNKFTNACIMRSFALNFPAGFFGMHPDGGLNDPLAVDIKARDIVQLITEKTTAELNGNIFNTQGEILKLYEEIQSQSVDPS
jgi:hypothetical protein